MPLETYGAYPVKAMLPCCVGSFSCWVTVGARLARGIAPVNGVIVKFDPDDGAYPDRDNVPCAGMML
jgi:hypothetical protein